MGFIACQAVDFKRKLFAGVKLSTTPYSQRRPLPRLCTLSVEKNVRKPACAGLST
jgi:hypothetical protein